MKTEKTELLIRQSATGQTRLLVTIPYSMRVGLNDVSKRIGLSQQSLIRAGIAKILADHEAPTRKSKPTTKPTSPPAPAPKASLGSVPQPKSGSGLVNLDAKAVKKTRQPSQRAGSPKS